MRYREREDITVVFCYLFGLLLLIHVHYQSIDRSIKWKTMRRKDEEEENIKKMINSLKIDDG